MSSRSRSAAHSTQTRVPESLARLRARVIKLASLLPHKSFNQNLSTHMYSRKKAVSAGPT
jgi:hypothetical protein